VGALEKPGVLARGIGGAPLPRTKKKAEPQVVPSSAGEVFQQPSDPAPARRAAHDPPTYSKPAAEFDVVPSVGRMVRKVQKGIEEAIPGFSFDVATASPAATVKRHPVLPQEPSRNAAIRSSSERRR